jgi:hypothetical protein
MRRGQAFWGLALIVLGGLLLLNTLGILSINVWSVIGPVFLILLGFWILSGWVFGREDARVDEVAIPLEGAEAARLHVDHGLGRMRIAGGAGEDALLSGRFGGGLDSRISREGPLLEARLKMAEDEFPWFGWWGGGSLNWDFGLNPNLPLTLKIDGGAGEAILDLADTRVTDLTYDAGLGTSRITLPARAGQTTVKVDGGVGTITLIIPEGVAARIKAESGIGTISVDKGRFPATRAGHYQSPDYETAENKADIVIDGGVGTATIR